MTTSVRRMVTGGNRKQSEEIIPKIPEDRHCFCANVTRCGDGYATLVVDPKDESGFVRNSGQNTEKRTVFKTNIKFSYMVFLLTLNFEFPPHFIPRFSSHFAIFWQTEKPPIFLVSVGANSKFEFSYVRPHRSINCNIIFEHVNSK